MLSYQLFSSRYIRAHLARAYTAAHIVSCLLPTLPAVYLAHHNRAHHGGGENNGDSNV